MTDQTIQECSKCGAEVVLGINAVMEKGAVVCDDCAGVKRGFAGMLLPEEKKALQETLQEDLQLTTDPRTRRFMQDALADATS